LYSHFQSDIGECLRTCEIADIFQTEKLKSACAQEIWDNLGYLKHKPEWVDLKKNFPELAFYVVEKFV
jgi:hypothetical protein